MDVSNKELNKENMKQTGSIKSYFKSSKTVRSRLPTPSSKQASASTGKKPKARPAPDFSKLHQKWETKLETGKACSKKPCTVSKQFDITKPGSQFSRVAKRELCFAAEDKTSTLECGTLNSPCTVRPAERTVETTPLSSKGVKRRVLGEISQRDLNSPTKSPRTSARQMSKSDLLPPPSKDADAVEFESDARALASILTNTGITPQTMHTPGRLTQASRPSVASLKPFPGVTNSLLQGSSLTATHMRNSIYISYKPRFNSVARPQTPKEESRRTTLKAERVPKSLLSDSRFKSPALRVASPAYNITKFHTDIPVQGRSKKCRWADQLVSPMHPTKAVENKCTWSEVLASPVPPNKAVQNKCTWSPDVHFPTQQTQEHLARKLCDRDYGDQEGLTSDGRGTPPAATSGQMSATTQEKQSQMVQPESFQNPNKYAQSAALVKDFPTKESTLSCNLLGQSRGNNVLATKFNKNTSVKVDCKQTDMVADTVVSQVQKFVSKALKHRRQSVDELSHSLSESQSFHRQLNSLQSGDKIVGELNQIKKLKEELAVAEKKLQQQLTQAVDTDTENIPPSLKDRPFAQENELSKDSVAIFTVKSAVLCPNDLDANQSAKTSDSSVPLDLSVKSYKTEQNPSLEFRHALDSLSLSDRTVVTSEKAFVELTPYITKEVKDLKLTETTSFSGVSKGLSEASTLKLAAPETNNLDVQGRPVASGSPVSSCPIRLRVTNSTPLVNKSKFSGLRIVSPLAEKVNTDDCLTTCGKFEDNGFIPPPIWTPLALRSATILSSPNPEDRESRQSSHAASAAGRCQSNDDSRDRPDASSPFPSASCINQSADSEDGSASRHLGVFGKGMTHSPSSPLQDNSAATATIPAQATPKHPATALHKSGQISVAGDNRKNVDAKDGHSCLGDTTTTTSADSSRLFGYKTPIALPVPIPLQSGGLSDFYSDNQQLQTEVLSGITTATDSCQVVSAPKTLEGHPKAFQGQASFQPRTAEKPRSSEKLQAQVTHSGNSVPRTNQRHQTSPGVASSSSIRQQVSPSTEDVGSLSLRGNVSQRLRPAARISPTSQSLRVLAGARMYAETLLDEECALFTCCRPLGVGFCDTSSRCPNPVARTLSQGDYMHFLPISDDYHGESGQLEGSAFSSYTPVHTRSMNRPN